MVLLSTSKSTETLYLDLDKPPKGWQWFAGNREQMQCPHLFLPADYRVPCLQPKSLFWAQIQKHALPCRQKTREWMLSLVPDQALRTQNETIRQATIAIPGKEASIVRALQPRVTKYKELICITVFSYWFESWQETKREVLFALLHQTLSIGKETDRGQLGQRSWDRSSRLQSSPKLLGDKLCFF